MPLRRPSRQEVFAEVFRLKEYNADGSLDLDKGNCHKYPQVVTM